jgi:uncharacterized membrane protein
VLLSSVEPMNLAYSRMLLVCVISGGLGSLIDSLMGALFQGTYVDSKRKVFNSKRTGAKLVHGTDLLSNTQVNMISSVLTALMVYFVLIEIS